MQKAAKLALGLLACLALALCVYEAVVHTAPRSSLPAPASAPVPASATPAQFINTGLVAGFGAAVNLSPPEQACVADAHTEVDDLEGAVDLLKKGDAQDILLGLMKIGKAFEAMPNTTKECKAAEADAKSQLAPKMADLEQALEAMKHPLHFVCHAGKDLVVNGADIFHDVADAVRAYDAKDYLAFGRAVGDALWKLVGPTPAPHFDFPPASATVAPDWEVVMLGVTEGFGMPLEETCIKDLGNETAKIAEAVDLFRSHDKGEVLKGLEALGKGLDGLPATFKACKEAGEDAAKQSEQLRKALSTVKGPLSFVFHFGANIIVNGVDLMEELHAAVVAYDSKQWGIFGYNLGGALRKILLGGAPAPLPLDPRQWKPVEWKKVPKGLVESLDASAEVAFNVELGCVESGEHDVEAIDHAILTIVQGKHAGNVTEVRSGLAELGVALQTVPDLLQTCKASEPDVQRLRAVLEALAAADAAGGVAAVGVEIGKDLLHNLLVNGVNVYDELLQAVRDRAAGMGEALGKDLGTILADVFLPKKKFAILMEDLYPKTVQTLVV